MGRGVFRRHHDPGDVKGADGPRGQCGDHGRVYPPAESQYRLCKSQLAEIIPDAQRQGGADFGGFLLLKCGNGGGAGGVCVEYHQVPGESSGARRHLAGRRERETVSVEDKFVVGACLVYVDYV